jgi:hypothetical protein
LSTGFSGLLLLDTIDALPVDPAVGMSIVVVLLWLWTVARRRFTDTSMFSLQTAGQRERDARMGSGPLSFDSVAWIYQHDAATVPAGAEVA